MKTKITLYQEVLGLRQEELLTQLDELTQTANNLRETATDVMAEQMEGQEELLPDAGLGQQQEGPSESDIEAIEA